MTAENHGALMEERFCRARLMPSVDSCQAGPDDLRSSASATACTRRSSISGGISTISKIAPVCSACARMASA